MRENPMQASKLDDDARTVDALAEIVERHWGYSSFRPLQEEAMLAVTARRDSLLVLPTGGGKSLCYQAPALLSDKLTVVVSPLISLMKDQVDDLVASGVAAAQINSAMSADAMQRTRRGVLDGKIKLLFVSPERLMTPSFHELLRMANVGAFAIDEAHCISHWGHDFRPEYRRLGDLREIFPGASLHGYTATATELVRGDIAQQLGLRHPLILVGSFDRPNLSYRILPRTDEMQQICEIVERHKDEAGIVYCIRRSDVDAIASALQSRGYDARRYHAGLTTEERTETQEAFAREKCNLIVATVAFGMGIDRSNIRYIVHAAMPKTIEHYQQETGRAGRDGLEAECTLLYSGADAPLWKNIIEKSAVDATPEFVMATSRHVDDMDRYCSSVVCRHRSLVQYFGQSYASENCGSCDVCLGDTEAIAESLLVAQKILSCVARLNESFGASHVAAVLHGERNAKITARHHERLSTFGILAEHDPRTIRDWIWQLVAHGYLRQEGSTYPLLKLTTESRRVFRGEVVPQLLRPVLAPVRRRSSAEESAWIGVDRELFDELRKWRREEAQTRGVAAFVIMSDATLRQIAAQRPSSEVRLRMVKGVGAAKLAEFGEAIVAIVREYSARNGVKTDLVAVPVHQKVRAVSPAKEVAFSMFRRNAAIEEVCRATQRAASTVRDYLAEFVRAECPRDVSAWVEPEVYATISATIDSLGEITGLRQIREAVGDSYGYEEIRIVLAHREALAEALTN